MNCLRPVKVPNPRYYQLLSDNNFIFRHAHNSLESQDHYVRNELELVMTSPTVFAPCRRCVNCLKMRSSEWVGRLSREYLSTLDRRSRVLFVTLTYSPEYYHDVMTSYRSDLSRLFDSLRSKFRRSIRHWCIGELGEKKGRFHIHCLFFDCPPELGPDSHFHLSKNGALMGSNRILRERWSKGIVDVGFCKSIGACSYVASYLVKGASESFFCPIVSSNKIGFSDFSDDELDRMRSTVRSMQPLYYDIGGTYKYSYPFSLIRKHFDPADRCAMRYASFIRNLLKGGGFVIGDFRTFDFREYISVVNARYYGTLLSNPISRRPISFDVDIDEIVRRELAVTAPPPVFSPEQLKFQFYEMVRLSRPVDEVC